MMMGPGSSVVEGFELGGWGVAELAVQSAVVEPVDVGEGGQLDVVGVTPRALATDELGLVEPVHALGERVEAPIDRQVDLRDFSKFSLGRWREQVVDLAGEVTLEAADDLPLGQSLFGPSFDVSDGRCVPPHSNDHGAVEGGVGLPVAASVEAMSAVGLA